MSTDTSSTPCPTCGQPVPSVGQRILAWRTAKNWTRAEAGAHVDVLPGRWGNWEMDVQRPSAAQQVALVELLGAELQAAIMGWTGDDQD